MNSVAPRPQAIKCTPRQERLVELILSTGETVNAVAADAGYANPGAAYKAWRSQAVQERYRELIHERMSLDVARALLARSDLLDSRSDYVKLQAAQDILDRAGFKPVEKRMVGIQGNLNVTIDLS